MLFNLISRFYRLLLTWLFFNGAELRREIPVGRRGRSFAAWWVCLRFRWWRWSDIYSLSSSVHKLRSFFFTQFLDSWEGSVNSCTGHFPRQDHLLLLRWHCWFGIILTFILRFLIDSGWQRPQLLAWQSRLTRDLDQMILAVWLRNDSLLGQLDLILHGPNLFLMFPNSLIIRFLFSFFLYLFSFSYPLLITEA